MTMIEEMIISGFISKIVSDVVDIPENLIKNAIRSADKKRRDKNQSIETRIYQVTIDSINKYTYDKFKGQDTLYDAAESIIRGFKGGNKIEAVRMGLKMLASQVTSETCEDFLKILYHEICIDENDILYREITLLQGEQTFETVREGFDVSNKNDEETHEKLNHVIEGINNLDKKIDGIENDEAKYYEIPVKNRAGEYADKWEKNVFLDNFDEEDERASDRVNVKLKDIYLENLLPSYKLNVNQGLSNNLKGRLEKYIVDKKDRKMLLILGQPGIGKSTLITWIMANLVEKKDEIFVYQFASDLKKVNWQGEDILEEIFKALRLGDVELKNKVLILDGFDEISISGNRERILNKLNQEVDKMERLGKFSLIITCRENYVNQSCLLLKTYITLQAWNKDQIISFCNIYEKKSSGNLETKFPEVKSNEILKNKEIFGIPLILYMILALDIDVEKSSSIADVYDQIFSLERGEIYNRCYDKEHRTNKTEIKKCIYQISQKIAFWIFENNDDEAFIYQKNFKEICDTVILEANDKSEDMQGNTLIGGYFKLNHCEGQLSDEVNFIHRSIYEYFVAVYFFESIRTLTSKEEVAGKLGELLKDGHISEQILEFIRFKCDCLEGKKILDISREVFDLMLQNGMTYYFIKEQKEPLTNILFREMNIFSNMLEIIHLWYDKLECVDKKLEYYLKYNHFIGLNLSGADLGGTNLGGVDLRGANLRKANLVGADLRGADLGEAYLIGADLNEANLFGANLYRTDLVEANLDEANLMGAHLREANLRGADLGGANLGRADLSNANLNGVKLIRANLHEANLIGACLRETYLSGAYLSETLFNEEQVNILHEKYDLRKSSVILSETNEIISYQEYCTIMPKDELKYWDFL